MITARAHTNIALIKYWGKRDKTLFLPYTSSLSMTLDAFYTETSVEFNQQDEDIFFLNGVQQDANELKKITSFIDLFRTTANNNQRVTVKSENFVPTAAGLASSASAYAALAMALNELFALNLDRVQLSRYARRGSGSSTRSLFGGLVEWDKGDGDKTSVAHPLLEAEHCPCAMIICLINSHEKEISSRQGMELTVNTSPFFKGFVDASAIDLSEMKQAIQDNDAPRIGEIAERNALRMHATMLGANPPFTYFEPKSIETIQFIKQLRKEGIPCYITMDAGPNVKVIVPKEHIDKVYERLQILFQQDQLIKAFAGPEAKIIQKDEDHD